MMWNVAICRRAVVCAASLALGAAFASPLTVHLRPGDPLEKGRQAIRDARKAGTLGADEPATIVLEPGVYTIANRFELGWWDGGNSAKGVVTYKAEKPGTVRLRGGKAIPRSVFRPAEGLPAGTLVADAAPYLISPAKGWPDVCEGVPRGPWLYAGGSPMPLARWPNAGWAVFTNAVNKGIKCPGSFQFVGDRTKRWDVSKGLWMTGYWTHDWADTYHRVKSIDLVSNVVAFAGISTYGVGKGTWGLKGRRFYAVNILSELDAPGEWFLDRKMKRLYYMPDPAKDGEELVLASFDSSLVQLLKGVKHVRFENLDFEYSHSPGIPALEIVDGADITVRGCTFSNIAGAAVKMKGVRCRVSDCRIWNTGGTAVYIDGGDRAALLPALNVLERTDIGFYGTFKRTFQPAVHLYGCGTAIRKCRFHDGPYIAVWYYGNEHLIAENLFERVVLEAGDSAAVYSGRDASSWGNVVFGNTIRELGAGSEMVAYRMGVYLDDCDCGDSIIGNTLSGMGNGMLLGGGNGLLVANNDISNCRNGISLDSRGDTWKHYTAAPGGNSWWHNMLKPFDYRAYPWCVAYPDAARMVDDHPNLPWMNVFTGNRMTNCKTDYNFAHKTLGVTNRMVFAAAPRKQPIAFADAAELRLEGPDGRIAAHFALDPAGRLSWSMQVTGSQIVATSPLGFTADGRDFGKLVVPSAAVRADGEDFAGASIPLRDLVSGDAVAFLEARVYADRAAWRWRIPGSGRRRVQGEGSAWRVVQGLEVDIAEEDIPSGWPKAWRATRGADAFSLVYALSPSGFDVEGDVVTPWRATRMGKIH